MNISELSEKQKQALMDMLVACIYADHKLTASEQSVAERLLDEYRFPSEYERQKFSDSSFTRTSRHSRSSETLRAYVKELSANFPEAKRRQAVFDTLSELLNSEGKASEEKTRVLMSLKQDFGL
jgi:uncharacterized tellurite resistance protein B-like protein